MLKDQVHITARNRF